MVQGRCARGVTIRGACGHSSGLRHLLRTEGAWAVGAEHAETPSVCASRKRQIRRWVDGTCIVRRGSGRDLGRTTRRWWTRARRRARRRRLRIPRRFVNAKGRRCRLRLRLRRHNAPGRCWRWLWWRRSPRRLPLIVCWVLRGHRR